MPNPTPTEPAAISPSSMLTTLAALARARFPGFAEAADAYLEAAARLAGVRSAFISRLDSQVMEVLGTWDDEGCAIPLGGVVPLEETFCQYVRASGDVVIVTDAASDPRVVNVATRTDFTIGSYLGVPLLLDDGTLIGSFCLLDPEPRAFTAEQADTVTVLAGQLVRLVERELARRAAAQLERDTSADLVAALSALDERGLLLQAVTHDLRTPLSSIFYNVDMLAAGMLGPLGPAQSAAVGRISASARFMGGLVTDLLDMSQAEQGGLVLASEPYRPAELLERVRELSAGQADESGLRVVAEAADAPPSAVGDPRRVQQILLNLVANALRHARQGEITLRAALRDGQLEYRICDQGQGIAPEALPQIWQLGWSGGGRGTGLGLYLVRRLAEAMGGSAAVESAPGAGCTFVVRLPLALERPTRVALT